MKKITVVLLSLLLILSMPLSAYAATNKAARIKATYTSIPETKKNVTEKERERNNFVFETGLKSQAKLSKKSTMSFKMLFPKSMFKNAGDDLSVNPALIACKNKKAKYWLLSEYNFCLFYNGSKVNLDVWDTISGKKIKAKKYATLKKSGNYYVLTVNNVPVVRNIWSVKDKDYITASKLNTKTKYDLIASIGSAFTMEKKGSSYIYLDQVTVKTASTQTVSYNSTKTYSSLEGFNTYDATTSGKELKVKLVKV